MLLLQEDQECTFYPVTVRAELSAAGATCAGHMGARGAAPAETYLERVERLACQDAQRVEAARAAQSHLYYSQFTFQPEINPRSRRIGRVRCFFLQGKGGREREREREGY
jgi:hypothetical protein